MVAALYRPGMERPVRPLAPTSACASGLPSAGPHSRTRRAVRLGAAAGRLGRCALGPARDRPAPTAPARAVAGDHQTLVARGRADARGGGATAARLLPSARAASYCRVACL